jgi:hypothetical protein
MALISEDLLFMIADIWASADIGKSEGSGTQDARTLILTASASNNAPMVPAANPSKQPLFSNHFMACVLSGWVSDPGFCRGDAILGSKKLPGACGPRHGARLRCGTPMDMAEALSMCSRRVLRRGDAISISYLLVP